MASALGSSSFIYSTNSLPKNNAHSSIPQIDRTLCFRSHQIQTWSSCICSASKSVVLYDLYDRQIPYEEAWGWQKQVLEHMCSTVAASEDTCTAGAALLLQHEPVYTLGAGATEDHLRFDPEAPPLPLFRIERGGEVTYHGPGQLVMYPILNLKLFQPDLHWYLRSLEEVIIRALEEVSGLHGERVAGLTGVWVNGKKVAAIGVRATRWVSYHGLALNVTADLSPFKDIVPCGISDKPVTSVVELLIEQARIEDPFAEEVSLREMMGAPEFQRRLLEEYRYGLIAAAEDVFGLEWSEIIEGDRAVEELGKMKKLS